MDRLDDANPSSGLGRERVHIVSHRFSPGMGALMSTCVSERSRSRLLSGELSPGNTLLRGAGLGQEDARRPASSMYEPGAAPPRPLNIEDAQDDIICRRDGPRGCSFHGLFGYGMGRQLLLAGGPYAEEHPPPPVLLRPQGP